MFHITVRDLRNDNVLVDDDSKCIIGCHDAGDKGAGVTNFVACDLKTIISTIVGTCRSIVDVLANLSQDEREFVEAAVKFEFKRLEKRREE